MLVLGGIAACATNETPQDGFAVRWSVDTVATIGVAAGDESQEFGRLVEAGLTPAGDVVLLDLQRPGVFWFDRDGRFVAVTSVGAGPGELAQPRAITVDDRGDVLVLDPGNARITRYRLDGGAATVAHSMSTAIVARSVCAVAGRLFVGALRDGMTVHELGDDGAAIASFAPAPEVEGLETLPEFVTRFARPQIVTPRFHCDTSRGEIVAAGGSHPLVRAFGPSGELRWSVALTDINPFRTVLEGRTVRAEFDAERPTHFVWSIVRWDDRHLLIQYDARLAGPPPGDREFHAIDSRFLNLETGAEVARSTELPLIAAGRDGRFVILENVPFPRATVVERAR